MNRLQIHRTEHSENFPFVMVSLTAARDSRLSFEARGLLVYMLGHSNSWSITPSELKAQGLGRDAARRVLGELEQYGYLKRISNSKPGQFAPDTWQVVECPGAEAPIPESRHRTPAPGNPERETPRIQYINKNHQDQISSEDHHHIDPSPEFEDPPGEGRDDDDFYLDCLDDYKKRFGDPGWAIPALRRQIKRLGPQRVKVRLAELQPKTNPWAYAVSILENMPTVAPEPPPPTPSPVSTIRSWARESLNDVPEWFAPNLEVMT